MRCTRMMQLAVDICVLGWWWYSVCIQWAVLYLISSSFKHHQSMLFVHSKLTIGEGTDCGSNRHLKARSFSREKHRLPKSCQSVRLHQRGSHWTDFREIWYWRLPWKSVVKILIRLKWGKNACHFTRIPSYVVLLPETLNRLKALLFVVGWNGIGLLG